LNRWRGIEVTESNPKSIRLAYADRALITRLSEIEAGAPVPVSSSSQPSLMAQMLEDLKLAPELNVLEVGAGTGYNAALMAHVVGTGSITTLDVDGEVVEKTRRNLECFADRRITVHHADGREKISDDASFDRIIVTAATPDVEPTWLEQLSPRGLMLAPLSLAPGLAFVIRGSVHEDTFHGRLTRAAYFMPLRAEDETGPSEFAKAAPSGDLRTLPAPWAGWFEKRRPRLQWLGFAQAIAFFGFIRGLDVHYRILRNSFPTYGVSQDDALCWYGVHDWHVHGDAGRDLGWELWRGFLDAGGPWPTEFRLRANPYEVPAPRRQTSYFWRGPRCYHRWELIEPRDRPIWI
jgi:protein-L-isoaspartate(D-aspartate) O-methyltransferase